MKYFLVFFFATVLFLLKSVFFQIFTSIIFAISLNPIVNFMEKRKIHRFFGSFLSVLLLFYLFLLVLLVIVPFIDKEIMPIIHNVDNLDYVKNVKIFFIELFSKKFTNTFQSSYFNKIITNFQQSGVNSLSSWIINLAFSMFSGFKNTFSGILSFFISVPFITFFLLKDKDYIIDSFRSILPKRSVSKFDIVLSSVHHELYEYLKRQSILTLCLITYYSIVCAIFNLSPLVGVLMGVISIIPYFGFIINTFLLFIMSFAYTLPLFAIISVFLLFLFAVIIENLILIPRLFLHRMHALYIFIFMIVFQDFVNLSSLLIAMPTCVALGIIFRSIMIFYRQTNDYKL